MSEEPTALACHPSGLQLAIGFKERVRIYNLFIDGIRHFQDLALKHCKQLEYSHGGQYLAVAVGINVLVYRTYELSCIGTFTGHIQPSRQLKWTADDSKLYSAGADGELASHQLSCPVIPDFNVVCQVQNSLFLSVRQSVGP